MKLEVKGATIANFFVSTILGLAFAIFLKVCFGAPNWAACGIGALAANLQEAYLRLRDQLDALKNNVPSFEITTLPNGNYQVRIIDASKLEKK